MIHKGPSTPPPFDSMADTLAHIKAVQAYMLSIVQSMITAAVMHDLSKMQEPEKSFLDQVNAPSIEKEYGYGTPEYELVKQHLSEFLDHHYSHNRHHPEHFEGGINDMTLLDLIEMLCDWKAASTRHADGSIEKSLEHNRDRFDISPQLMRILENTVKFLDWRS